MFFGMFNITDSEKSLLAEDSGQAKRAKAEVETKTETEITEPVNSAVALSEPLAKFFGTGETEMTDEEIIRRVWEYIKLNNLEVGLFMLLWVLKHPSCFFMSSQKFSVWCYYKLIVWNFSIR